MRERLKLTNRVEFSAEKILMHLDGWRIGETANTADVNETISPFMTDSEATGKANKVITNAELELFFNEALNQAYMYTNRLNVDDLTVIEVNVFTDAVCKWAASNLWNKYNIRVNNEDMEDTYVQSYGGLLYKSAITTLNQFINQRITGFSTITDNTDNDDDLWIV